MTSRSCAASRTWPIDDRCSLVVFQMRVALVRDPSGHTSFCIQKRARAIELEKAKVDCSRKAAELEEQAKQLEDQAKVAQEQAKPSRDLAQQHRVYVNGLFRRRYITALLHSEHRQNRHRTYNRFATDSALIWMVRSMWKCGQAHT